MRRGDSRDGVVSGKINTLNNCKLIIEVSRGCVARGLLALVVTVCRRVGGDRDPIGVIGLETTINQLCLWHCCCLTTTTALTRRAK